MKEGGQDLKFDARAQGVTYEDGKNGDNGRTDTTGRRNRKNATAQQNRKTREKKTAEQQPGRRNGST